MASSVDALERLLNTIHRLSSPEQFHGASDRKRALLNIEDLIKKELMQIIGLADNSIATICNHHNDDYGYCILPFKHEPYDNGFGVFYRHKYERNAIYGNLDARESIKSKENPYV